MRPVVLVDVVVRRLVPVRLVAGATGVGRVLVATGARRVLVTVTPPLLVQLPVLDVQWVQPQLDGVPSLLSPL